MTDSLEKSSLLSACATHPWFDLNTAEPQSLFSVKSESNIDTEDLKHRLYARLKEALHYLFPLGKISRNTFVIGDTLGKKGKSLHVELTGDKIGLWHDFATEEGSDIIALWGQARGFPSKGQFAQIALDIEEWLGSTPKDVLIPALHADSNSNSNLGIPTARWDYTDKDGNLIACIERYDTENGKEFRPWDVKARAFKAPIPRPLYNQVGLANSETAVLAEGEKCAEVLIKNGICATTAMNGANAGIHKTDWSPLIGKHVLIWPDNDEPGKKYADELEEHLKTIGVASLAKIIVPEDKPESWDAADAVLDGIDIKAFIDNNAQMLPVKSPSPEPNPLPTQIPASLVGQLRLDTTPLPEDWVSPRILTSGGLLVLGGAPKVGKTDLLLNWLAHLAGGLPFLGMMPPRPLKIFYLQTEISRPYLSERIKALQIGPKAWESIDKNMAITDQAHLILNEDGIKTVYSTVTVFFKPEEVDVLVIDPLRNVFDGGKSGSENDNTAMLTFLQDRVERLRNMINPNAGIILVHHTKKITKQMVDEEPFQALSGAASLRGYYTSGMILFRPDEKQEIRQLIFELRNGKSIPTKLVDKKEGRWLEMEPNSERLVKKEHGAKLDAERKRHHDVILQLLYDEARDGKLYVPSQFCQAFENHAGLGGERSIHTRINVLATKGFIKFNKDEAIAMGIKSKCGLMCVEGMEVPVEEETDALKPFLPTHFKHRESGAILPVENPEAWVYLDE